MSSSRSIAAARARRTNEQAPPVNGSRPITSIGSQAAFSTMSQPPPSNIRLARGPAPQQQMYQQMPPQMPPQMQQQMYQQMPTQMQQQQQMPPPQMPSNTLPFTKLSISDAIGLITLRLGRVEQFIIDLENGEHANINIGGSSIPDNSRIIDNSVLNTIVNRLDSLEKNVQIPVNNESITEDITIINDSIKKLNDELVKTNLAAAKHSEQMLRFERDFVENKDILKTLLIKFDSFVNETNDRFSDYEFAIAELEKTFQLPPEENPENFENSDNLHHESTIISNDSEIENSNIMTVDLKNMIKQELANNNV